MIAATGFRAVDWLLIAVILVLLAISGLLALAETSLVRTSRVLVRTKATYNNLLKCVFISFRVKKSKLV